MQDIIALKHTFPNFKKQARVHNKEQVRTAVSFKATFFRRAFRFLLLPFRIKHMALPKGTLNSTLLIPPIFLGYCYICFLCIHCCCCPAVQAQRKFLYITHLWSAINSETNCHLNSVSREAESLILCSVTYWSRSILRLQGIFLCLPKTLLQIQSWILSQLRRSTLFVALEIDTVFRKMKTSNLRKVF